MPRKDQKRTRIRRNRRFGDIHGGRVHRRFSDNIYKRVHSLKPPSVHEALPKFIVENPSRDFYFPVSLEQVRNVLDQLPADDVAGVTHVWMRRAKKSEYRRGELSLAAFICGSGVRCVLLYPWPTDNCLRYCKRPSRRSVRFYARWGATLERDGTSWLFRWTQVGVRRFYLEHLLLHEVGHHVDWYSRHWSAANGRQIEDEADRYAYWWSSQLPRGNGAMPAGRSGTELQPAVAAEST